MWVGRLYCRKRESPSRVSDNIDTGQRIRPRRSDGDIIHDSECTGAVYVTGALVFAEALTTFAPRALTSRRIIQCFNYDVYPEGSSILQKQAHGNASSLSVRHA